MIAAPLFHSWGFAHFTLGIGLTSTIVLRRKFDPEATLALTAQHQATALAVVPGDAPAHPRAGRRGDRRATTSRSARRSRSAARPCRPAVREGARGLRPGPLQPLRLHRGGVGGDRHAGGPRRGPGDRRAPPRGTVVKLLDDEGREVPRGETGRIFVANEMLFEGYTGGGDQGRVDGLMCHRRRRALRRGRAPLRRRPRRRHDRLGRRERLPPGGRGAALTAHDAVSDAAVVGVRRRGVRPAPAAVVRQRRARSCPRTSQGPTSRSTSRATRCRATSPSWTSCRATRPARSSSASCATRRSNGLGLTLGDGLARRLSVTVKRRRSQRVRRGEE